MACLDVELVQMDWQLMCRTGPGLEQQNCCRAGLSWVGTEVWEAHLMQVVAGGISASLS